MENSPDKDKEDIFRLSEIVSVIEDSHWERFLFEKLAFNPEEVRNIRENYRSKEKYEAVMKWRNTTDAKDICSHLQSLVQDFKSESIKRRREVYQRLRYPAERGKGCALIIVNSFAWNREHGRKEAAKRDIEAMRSLWQKTLKCDLFGKDIHKNQSAKQMQSLLKDVAMMKKEYDYVVVVISTHGGLYPESVVQKLEVNTDDTSALGERQGKENSDVDELSKKNLHTLYESMKKAIASSESSIIEVFFGDDCVPVREQTIKEYFYNSETDHALHDIPKFFIFDYCRGSSGSVGHQMKALEVEVAEQIEGRTPPTMSAVSDVLVAYSTHPNFAAFDHTDGSWLISTIADVFKSNYEQDHVVDMLTVVNAHVEAKIQNACIARFGQRIEWKAMSIFESSLDKDFYLKPKSVENSTNICTEIVGSI